MVACRLMKDGAVLEEVEIPLAANGQEAQYIEEMFTFTGADMPDFVGSVRCMAPSEGKGCSPEAVELDASNQIFTTLRWCLSRDDFPARDVPLSIYFRV